MKFKRFTAVITTVVMAFSMVTAASAEDALSANLASSNVSTEMSIENVFSYEPDSGVNGTATYAATKTLNELLKEYPNGSHYTYDGKACETHKNCSYSIYSPCNCINYDDSIQCVAFAKYVYYNLRGKKWSTNDRTYLNLKNPSGATLKSYLYGKPAGTYIYFYTANGNDHSLAITNTTSTDITVYEANSMTNDLCGVRYTKYSWDDFSKRFSELVHYVY